MSETNSNSSSSKKWIIAGVIAAALACCCLIAAGAFFYVGSNAEKIITAIDATAVASVPTDGPNLWPTPGADATEMPQQPGSGSSLDFDEYGYLFDDFSNPSSGWFTTNDDNGSASYEQGGLLLSANPGITVISSMEMYTVYNASIDVESAFAGGSKDNLFGVICRASDLDNFYTGVISSDGYAAILKFQNGEPGIISEGGELKFAGAINQDEGAVNNINLLCSDEFIALMVNGETIASATDTALGEGVAGLLLSSNDESATSILFDNISIYSPEMVK